MSVKHQIGQLLNLDCTKLQLNTNQRFMKGFFSISVWNALNGTYFVRWWRGSQCESDRFSSRQLTIVNAGVENSWSDGTVVACSSCGETSSSHSAVLLCPVQYFMLNLLFGQPLSRVYCCWGSPPSLLATIPHTPIQLTVPLTIALLPEWRRGQCRS